MVGVTVNQQEMAKTTRGRIMALDSAYDIDATNRDRDVVVNASYCGILPSRFIAVHRPRAVISVDCAVGPAGVTIAGLYYFEGLGIPCAVADVMTVHLGEGVDVYSNGIISFANLLAQACGVRAGMTVAEATRLLLDNDFKPEKPDNITNRVVMKQRPDGRQIVCTDSIAFGIPGTDERNVLLTAGHTGIRAVPNILRCRPYGLIASDGGMGRDNAGVAGIFAVEPEGIVAACVDARRASMGDGLSTYHDGIISAANAHARELGVAVGMPAAQAATMMLDRE